jgi:hypothetical protein
MLRIFVGGPNNSPIQGDLLQSNISERSIGIEETVIGRQSILVDLASHHVWQKKNLNSNPWKDLTAILGSGNLGHTVDVSNHFFPRQTRKL